MNLVFEPTESGGEFHSQVSDFAKSYTKFMETHQHSSQSQKRFVGNKNVYSSPGLMQS